MGNTCRRLLFGESRSVPRHAENHDTPASSVPLQIISPRESEERPQTEAAVKEDSTRKQPDTAAEETSSPPPGLSSLQSTVGNNEKEVEAISARVSIKDRGGTKALSSTVASTPGDHVSKKGSSGELDYLKKMSRQERRKIELEMKRKRRPALTVESVRRVVQGLAWSTLCDVLIIPYDKNAEIFQAYPTDQGREAAVIRYWLLRDPLASWRRLADQLYRENENYHAEIILHCAEELTDTGLTYSNVSSVLSTMSVEKVEDCLFIPGSVCAKIRDQCNSEDERRTQLVNYWLKTSPYSSWQWLSGEIHYLQEHSAQSAVKRFVQRVPEPTLTLENLNSLLEGVKNLDNVAACLQIPYSKQRQIHKQYSSISQHRQEYCQYWLTQYPSPSWLVVANALYCSSEYKELEVLQKLYIKGTSESRRLLQDALKFGYTKAYISKMLFYGTSGVGKSCSKDVIAGDAPPDVRQSTPLATRPVTLYQLDASKEIWKTFTSKDRMEFCAQISKSLSPQVQEGILEKNSLEENTLTVSVDDRTRTSSAHVHSASNPLDEKITDRSSTSDHQPLREHPVSGISSKPLSSIDVKVAGVINNVLSKLFVMIDECPEDRDAVLSLLHKLQIVDSGGQPQFHEVLPIFLRRMSLYAFVFKLSEELSNYPDVAYFEAGVQLGKTYRSKQTTEQMFRQLLQTVHTHRSSQREGQDDSSRILLLGTHNDLVEKCKREPIGEKNRIFSEILLPEFKKYVQYYNIGTKELIFPMNAKNPGNAERDIAKKIRSIVTNECRPDPSDLPLQWLCLEIVLEEITRELDRELLSKAECLEIARKLEFEEDELEAALVYLDELSLVSYYPDVLPEIVFTNPQVLLEKISELVRMHFELMHGIGPHHSCCVGDMWQEFFDYALVTIDFLSQKPFEKHYIPELFEPQHLVSLFKKLFIFAFFADNKLFVPCLLQMLDKSDLAKHRESFQSAAAPLVLKFGHGGPRLGLFCGLMSFLTSTEVQPSWKLRMQPKSVTPACLNRNCIQLTLTHASCSVMLVDTFDHFEVHVLATEDVCREQCPYILQTVITGCQKSALNLHYTNSKPEAALICPCGNGDIHVANTNNLRWTCSVNEGVGAKMTSSQQLWFSNDSSTIQSGQKITIGDLQLLKCSSKGDVRRLSIIKRASHKWRLIADRLSNDPNMSETLGQRFNNDPSLCLRQIFIDCFINNEPANNYSQTWSGIVELLEDIEEEELAKEVNDIVGKM